MRSILRMAMLAAVGAFGGAGRTAAAAEPPPTQTQTQTALQLVTKPFAPYAYAAAEGRPAGAMVELMQAACARLGWRCAIEVLPWRRAYAMAARGEVDGVFPIADSPRRRQAFRLSPAVVQARYVLLARPDRILPGRIEPAALARRTLAAYGPSDATATLQQLVDGVPGARIETELDHRTVLRKLALGRYGDDGLALVNETVAQGLRLDDGAAGGLQVAAVVGQVAYAFAFVPQRIDAARATAFAEALFALCREGRSAAIFQRHGLSPLACQRPAGLR